MSALRWAVSSVAILWLFAAAYAAPLHTTPGCNAPQEMTRFTVTLPNTARAIRSGKKFVILAIGSSSTEGVGASDTAHTYPVRLAEELRHRWPRLAVTVINKGIGGEIASQILARFERDVLAYHPQLVIWQTGSKQALRSGDIKELPPRSARGSAVSRRRSGRRADGSAVRPARTRAAHPPVHRGFHRRVG